MYVTLTKFIKGRILSINFNEKEKNLTKITLKIMKIKINNIRFKKYCSDD